MEIHKPEQPHQSSRIVEGALGAGKTSHLLDHTEALLRQVPSSSVLVLCSNHQRQKAFKSELLSRLDCPFADLPVYTFSGFVRTKLFDYWPLVEAQIQTSLGKDNARIRPELSGMVDSEWILSLLVAGVETKNPSAFEDFPGANRSLVKQLLRRLRLRSENALSRDAMIERSILLEEPCMDSVKLVEQWFDRLSYETRFLDASKQLDVFQRLLKEESLLAGDLRKNIQYLVVDDVDETTAIQQSFIRWIEPSLKLLVMAADPNGGSRRGYLNANPYHWKDLKSLRAEGSEVIQLTRDDAVSKTADTVLKNWEKTTGFDSVSPVITLDDEAMTRAEMMDRIVADILRHLAQGVPTGELMVVLPKTDLLTLYQLNHRLKRRAVPVQILSGTQRAMDNPWSQCVIYLLQILNAPVWKSYPSRWEIRHLLVHVLGLAHLDPERIGRFCDWMIDPNNRDESEVLPAPDKLVEQTTLDLDLVAKNTSETPQSSWISDDLVDVYTQFYDSVMLLVDLSFEAQLFEIYERLVRPLLSETTELDPLRELIQSYERQCELYQALNNGNHDLTEDVLGGLDFDQFWVTQVKYGSVADTPDSPPEIDPNAIVVGTPQKIIDFEIRRNFQFWLDVSSREWCRSDNAPLYNGWVHSAVWDGDLRVTTDEFQDMVIRARAGHIQRALVLLAGKKIHAYSSELDDFGFNQDGMMKDRLLQDFSGDETGNIGEIQLAKLREDQLPVLSYSFGTMAVSAVPGAGKTFVNVELILSLIKQGVAPSSILVLTYMDSAAKTLLGRVKKKLQGVTRELPVISTIHSLAFKMLTENDHALRLGFSIDDLKVMDDFEKAEMIQAAAGRTMPESVKNPNDWQRAVSRGIDHAKTHRLSPVAIEQFAKNNPQHFRLKEFLPAYQMYLSMQKQQGTLDFTDLIVKATELLERFDDIREKYQARYQVVIEDEAQDSSTMLQHFIGLLGGEKPNLIRTGDTNQSITTTFSSADTSVFRNFIKSAGLVVEMDHSGRCAPAINELANFFMTTSEKQPVLKEAFQPMMMKTVEGHNPELILPVTTLDFDDAEKEEAWIVETIHQLRELYNAENPERHNKGLSIAVLVRQNNQAHHFTDRLQRAGIPAISLGDQLTVTPVFHVMVNFLRLLENPGNLEAQTTLYDAMMKAHLLAYDENRMTFLKTTPLFYIKPDAVRNHEYLSGDEALLQLYYDWQELYQLAQSGSLFRLMIQLAERLFDTVEDRSNGYMCALLADEVLSLQDDLLGLSPLEWVIQHFTDLQNSKRSRRGFGDLMSRRPEEFVQVMSLHKSKGQEFDVVFMPHLQTNLFPDNPDKIRFDEGDKLQLALTAMDNQDQGFIDPETAKQESRLQKIEEEARLVYVGITRAKRALLVTCHHQAMSRYGKMQTKAPALAYQMIHHWVKEFQPQVVDLNALPLAAVKAEDDTEAYSEVNPEEVIS